MCSIAGAMSSNSRFVLGFCLRYYYLLLLDRFEDELIVMFHPLLSDPFDLHPLDSRKMASGGGDGPKKDNEEDPFRRRRRGKL